MDNTNPIDLAKPTQPNPKNYVGSDNWVDISFKNEKLIQKNRVSGKTNMAIHRLGIENIFYKNNKDFAV
jgi:hypothetical protein